jgi:ferredoxin-thioredoxin reductase catalytic chain
MVSFKAASLSMVALLALGLVLPTQAFSPDLSPKTMRTPINIRYITILNGKDSSMTEEEREIAMDKALKAMTAFSNKYCENTGTTYCSDLTVPSVVIKGLAEHKVTLGTPLCPCRFYDDKEKEAKEGYWNCPCVPMRERHECHCMLFLTEENDFAGDRNVSLYGN